MGVLLGFDFGQKRIGVAQADEELAIATPLTTIDVRNREQVLAEIMRLIDAQHAVKIVVGLPKTLKGEIGPAAQKVLGDVEWLKTKLQCPCVLWDERLSTKEVERILLEADLSRSRRKEVRDSLAAQRILQSYMDFHRNQT